MAEEYIDQSCPVCGAKKFVFDRNRRELICTGCGYVMATEDIETGPEWRSFEGDEVDRSRVGLPPSYLLQDKGLSTIITGGEEDSAGRKIDLKRRRDFNRLRKWQQRISAYSSMERNLQNAITYLNQLGDKLNVPRPILEHAAYLYRKALKMDLVRGRAINSIVAAALYIALRHYGAPRTIKSVARAAGVDKKELGRCYRLLVRELRIKMPVIDPIQYIRRIASAAGLNDKVVIEAEKIIKMAKEKKITAGKDPVGLAAAAVYFAAAKLGYKITQRDIALAADITEVTVRNRCKSLAEKLGLEEPQKTTEKRGKKTQTQKEKVTIQSGP